MQLGGVQATNNFSHLRFGGALARVRADRQASPDRSADRIGLQDLFRDLSRFRDEFGRLEATVRRLRRGGGGTGLAAISGDNPLGLDASATQASIRSEEEVNTLTSSYGPTNPAFSGLSTASPTIGGLYDGSNGDDTLSFVVRSGGIVGVTKKIEIDVLDGTGDRLETLDFDNFAPAGTVVTLKNGLELSLSNGALVTGDSFDVTVSNSTPQSVDPDASFSEGPGFDPGFSVQGGSFDISGVSIDVLASDSINDVLARINASAAGVTATFDSAAEQVVITANDLGSVGDFVLDNDVSGFLEAVKLAGAKLDAGIDDDRTLALEDVTAFQGIQSGSFQVNGQLMLVDPRNDSLLDVLARIEATVSGVTATYDPANDRVRIVQTDPEQTLELDDGTSGLFTALGIDTGVVEPKVVDRGLTGLDSGEFARRIERLGYRLGQVLEDRSLINADVETGRLRTELITGLSALFTRENLKAPASALYETPAGIRFDLRREASEPLAIDLDKFRQEARQNPGALLRLLEGRGDDRPGLLDILGRALDETEDRLVERFGEGGALLDQLA